MVSTLPLPTHNVMGNWGKAYTTEQVSRLAPPPQTETHRPYDHHTLFDMVSNGLQRAGFEHSEPLHYVGDGRLNKASSQVSPAKFMTVMNIQHDQISTKVGGLDMMRQVFIQNSYDKTLSIRLITGIEVCICTNGMTMGHVEGEVRRKQTKGVGDSIYGLVYGGIDQMLGDFKHQEQQIHSLQNTEMTNRMADHIIMDAMRAGVINPAGVKDVWNKWDNPNYPEYKERNAWSLVNAFTERGRGRNIFHRHADNNRLLEIVADYSSADTAAPANMDYTDSANPVSADFH